MWTAEQDINTDWGIPPLKFRLEFARHPLLREEESGRTRVQDAVPNGAVDIERLLFARLGL